MRCSRRSFGFVSLISPPCLLLFTQPKLTRLKWGWSRRWERADVTPHSRGQQRYQLLRPDHQMTASLTSIVGSIGCTVNHQIIIFLTFSECPSLVLFHSHNAWNPSAGLTDSIILLCIMNRIGLGPQQIVLSGLCPQSGG